MEGFRTWKRLVICHILKHTDTGGESRGEKKREFVGGRQKVLVRVYRFRRKRRGSTRTPTKDQENRDTRVGQN